MPTPTHPVDPCATCGLPFLKDENGRFIEPAIKTTSGAWKHRDGKCPTP